MRNVDSFARQAAAQYGLLSIRQLRDHVGSDHEITRLLQSGVLHRQRRGVYRLVGSPLSWNSDLMAACLASPRLIVGSHRSASRLWGLRTVDDQVEVSVRYPGRLELPGVIVHRIRDLTEHDFTYIEGVPVTTPARTLCDAGLVFGDKEVQRMINHALAKKIVTSRDLWRFRVRVGRQGRTGVGALERALTRLPPDISRADSGPEIEMRQLCREFGVPTPIWQHPVVAQGVAYRIDFAYPDRRIAIEYDEFDPHTTPEAFVHDRRRQNDLQECGWTVMRFTWDDLRDDRAGVARRLHRILESVNGSSRNS